jgi:hypothetical protein
MTFIFSSHSRVFDKNKVKAKYALLGAVYLLMCNDNHLNFIVSALIDLVIKMILGCKTDCQTSECVITESV